MGTRFVKALATPAGRPPPPKKSLGQNFLVDTRVRARILAAADLSSEDVVLEIGSGRGFLTRGLAERAGRVVAVEIDGELSRRLSGTLDDQPQVTVVEADAREVDIDTLVPARTPYKLVANLPYYAASPIIRRFLEAEHKPKVMVVMVQREVARTMCAGPGKMTMLSVATQVYGKPRVVCSVSPRAFKPQPKITSAVVRIDVYDEPIVPMDPPEEFFALVRAGFSTPRKQIRNSLAVGLGIPPTESEVMLSEAGIDPRRRAQTLSLDEWSSLLNIWGSAHAE
jgi:16S rRNA (adenine1518-N6/adenine1519-N6)-dimethyltransferase